MISFQYSANSITVNYPAGDSFKTTTFLSSEPEYAHIVDLIKNNRKDEIPAYIDRLAIKVNTSDNKDIRITDGVVYIDDIAAPIELGRKISEYAENGLPFDDLVKFHRNLQLNTSYTAIRGCFRFLEANKHPLTDRGTFIAYKKVKNDFTDCRTGTFDNSIGAVVSMPRNQVDEDPEVTCSKGLHVAAYEYAHTFYNGGNDGNGIIIEVEVNPKDVVAVPKDYNEQKMRICEYKVLGVSNGERREIRVAFNPPVENDSLDDENDETENINGTDGDDWEDEDDEDNEDNEDDVEIIVMDNFKKIKEAVIARVKEKPSADFLVGSFSYERDQDPRFIVSSTISVDDHDIVVCDDDGRDAGAVQFRFTIDEPLSDYDAAKVAESIVNIIT